MDESSNRFDETKAVTLNNVAEKAGVSRATVSLVLRASPLVASETRERVTDAIASVGYVYNRGAARLRTGRSGTIGLIVPEITNPFYAELTAGIDDVFDKEGRLTFLANSNELPERQDRFVRRIREQGVDGIILCAAEGTTGDVVAQLRRWRLPFVQILREIEGAVGDFVAPDFRRGTELAVDHLVARGHRSIALMSSIRKTSAALERVNAFQAALQRYGLPSSGIHPCVTDRAAAFQAAEMLLTARDPPTGIICHNDIMALGVLYAAQNRSSKAGRAFGVVGFDDIPEGSHCVPKLTTVATRPAAVGRAAALLLMRRIAAPKDPPERRLIAPKLIARDT
ncbi:LacI family DNA-binding transcriptional regulator [Lichenihabitans sp. PAMC28606]|uniref:LacI family DNA-binding transcriptional regulator n=1 Tax=Lichenihabitans sp. PAMC28606 TaxID=2880932 RepID=UPI001D0B43DF|nr:LacI family DNA-binding transcriptional regulator [Lichenihabitans sp. PAMC28606]UDL94760.1 LacI family DNA-binding transcriptional regulator [Lichenihabitans sp. PAMC28606]